MIWLVHPDSLQTFFKLVYAMLHQKGQLNVGYIDDSYDGQNYCLDTK